MSGTAGLASGVVGTGLSLINPAEYFLLFGREYVVSRLLKEKDPQTRKELIDKYLIIFSTQSMISPFERIRIIIQNQQIYKINKSAYLGLFDCFFHEVRNKGLRVLWRGSFPMMIYQMFYHDYIENRIISLFNSRDIYKKNSFYDMCHSLRYLYLFDLFLSFLSHPFELVAIKKAANPNHKVYFNENLREYNNLIFVNPYYLYKGFSANLLMINLNYSLTIPILFYIGKNAKDNLDFLIYIVCAVSAIEYATYPFHLIKRRLITQTCEYSVNKYSGVNNAIKTIFKDEHIYGFYKGAYLQFIVFGIRKILFLSIYSLYINYKL